MERHPQAVRQRSAWLRARLLHAPGPDRRIEGAPLRAIGPVRGREHRHLLRARRTTPGEHGLARRLLRLRGHQHLLLVRQRHPGPVVPDRHRSGNSVGALAHPGHRVGPHPDLDLAHLLHRAALPRGVEPGTGAGHAGAKGRKGGQQGQGRRSVGAFRARRQGGVGEGRQQRSRGGRERGRDHRGRLQDGRVRRRSGGDPGRCRVPRPARGRGAEHLEAAGSGGEHPNGVLRSSPVRRGQGLVDARAGRPGGGRGRAGALRPVHRQCRGPRQRYRHWRDRSASWPSPGRTK